MTSSISRKAVFCVDYNLPNRLASGWGSGAVEFPYLVTPNDALKSSFNSDNVTVNSFLTNEAPPAASLEDQDLCFVFVNADSGEGFHSDGEIQGDRNDLYPQKDGDSLVRHVAGNCGAGQGITAVIVHSVGPVIVERWINLHNVKVLLFSHLPGQESGNSLVREHNYVTHDQI